MKYYIIYQSSHITCIYKYMLEQNNPGNSDKITKKRVHRCARTFIKCSRTIFLCLLMVRPKHTFVQHSVRYSATLCMMQGYPTAINNSNSNGAESRVKSPRTSRLNASLEIFTRYTKSFQKKLCSNKLALNLYFASFKRYNNHVA